MEPWTARDRRGARAAAILGFTSLFVYPAVAIGNTAAIAVPNVVAAGLVLLWLWRITASGWGPFVAMVIPLVLSGSYVLATGSAVAGGVVVKTTAVLALAFLTVIPTCHLLRAGHAAPLVHGLAAAIVVHAAVGAYQLVAFEAGVFPLRALLDTNPGLALPPETIEAYAEYVKRPFGLFPEPSAMAACIGPVLVVIAHQLLAPRGAVSGRRRPVLLALALGGGLALVILSRSGLAAGIVLAVPIPALAAAFAIRRSLLLRGFALLATLGGVAAVVLWLTFEAGARFDLAQNDSWQARFASAQVGVGLLNTPANLLFGVGPGQSVQLLRLNATGAGDAPITAVWSAALAYAIETGLVGVVSMAGRALASALAIRRGRARLVAVACALVWASGIIAATSYLTLPALWTTLALLLSWPCVAGPRETSVADPDGATAVADEGATGNASGPGGRWGRVRGAG
jgi:hypothetical protein